MFGKQGSSNMTILKRGKFMKFTLIATYVNSRTWVFKTAAFIESVAIRESIII